VLSIVRLLGLVFMVTHWVSFLSHAYDHTAQVQAVIHAIPSHWH
jgi:hypothetical protein